MRQGVPVPVSLIISVFYLAAIKCKKPTRISVVSCSFETCWRMLLYLLGGSVWCLSRSSGYLWIATYLPQILEVCIFQSWTSSYSFMMQKLNQLDIKVYCISPRKENCVAISLVCVGNLRICTTPVGIAGDFLPQAGMATEWATAAASWKKIQRVLLFVANQLL